MKHRLEIERIFTERKGDGTVDVSSLNLSGADLSGKDLSHATVNGTNLSGADLTNTVLVGAELRSANLSEAKMPGADLDHADLSGANLTMADLSGASLSGTKLSGANCIYTNFSNARFYESELTAAILYRSDFTCATIEASRLSRARLSNAILGGTKFVRCDLSKCEGLSSVTHVGPSSVDNETLEATFQASGNRLGLDAAQFYKDAGVEDTTMEVFRTRESKILYEEWAKVTLAQGLSGLLEQRIRAFEEAGLQYIDILEKAQEDGLAGTVEEARNRFKASLKTKKKLRAFEELELFIDIVKIKDPFEGWRALGKAISERWPKGHSVAKAIREMRR